jgi:DNA replication protein DnaC
MVKLSLEMMRRFNIPEVHWGASLADIPNTCRHKKPVRDYLDSITDNVNKASGVLFFGEYSSGKSALAAICLKAAAVKGIVSYWVVARDIPGLAIEKPLFEPGVTVYERCLSVPLLVVDELQVRAEIRGIEQFVEMLIRARVDAKRCTILTTNHTPAYLAEKFPAMYAVLQEAVTPIKVTGHDFRKGIANKRSGVS